MELEGTLEAIQSKPHALSRTFSSRHNYHISVRLTSALCLNDASERQLTPLLKEVCSTNLYNRQWRKEVGTSDLLWECQLSTAKMWKVTCKSGLPRRRSYSLRNFWGSQAKCLGWRPAFAPHIRRLAERRMGLVAKVTPGITPAIASPLPLDPQQSIDMWIRRDCMASL